MCIIYVKKIGLLCSIVVEILAFLNKFASVFFAVFSRTHLYWSANFLHSKLNCLTIIQNQKVFTLELSLNNL